MIDSNETAPAFREAVLPHWLPAPLREPRRPWLAVLLGWALAFFPSLALSALAQLLFTQSAMPDFPVRGWPAVFMLAVFSPVVETLIMAGVLELLLRVMRPTWAILASAIGWGIAHSLAAPAWGLVIWWPFLIFSTLYTVWRPRSRWLALAIVMLAHAAQNIGPAWMIASQ